MRSRSSQFLALAAIGTATLSLAACVQPASNGKTSVTLAPLALPPVTSMTTSVAVPVGSAAAPPSQTVVLGPGSVSTGDAATTIPTAATAITAVTGGAATTTSVGGGKSYTILASDTLYSIARRCAQTADALATFNSWSDGANHLIHPGDVIAMPCIPSASTSSGSGSGTSSATTTPVKSSGASATTTTVKSSGASATTTVGVTAAGTYTIVAGDYLAGIAAKVGTTIDAIVKVNGWPDRTHAIYPGDVIKLPAKT